jgi:hypothetical protein
MSDAYTPSTDDVREVYLVVTHEFYHYGSVQGVFASEAAADTWIEAQAGDGFTYRIDEREVQE